MLATFYDAEYIDSLQGRGLKLDFHTFNEALRAIGFKRFDEYLAPFTRNGSPAELAYINHLDLYGVSLKEVLDLYKWDSGLRSIVLSGIEELEIWMQSLVGGLLGLRHPFAHLRIDCLHGNVSRNQDFPMARQAHDSWVERYSKRVAKRGSPQITSSDNASFGPPIWDAVQLLEFGLTTRLIKMMQHTDKLRISESFGAAGPKQLDNWLAVMNHLRNLAAHQERLWNRDFVISPSTKSLPESSLQKLQPALGASRIAGPLVVLSHILSKRPMSSDFPRRLTRHLEVFPGTSRIGLGMTGLKVDSHGEWQLNPHAL